MADATKIPEGNKSSAQRYKIVEKILQNDDKSCAFIRMNIVKIKTISIMRTFFALSMSTAIKDMIPAEVSRTPVIRISKVKNAWLAASKEFLRETFLLAVLERKFLSMKYMDIAPVVIRNRRSMPAPVMNDGA